MLTCDYVCMLTSPLNRLRLAYAGILAACTGATFCANSAQAGHYVFALPGVACIAVGVVLAAWGKGS